MHACMYVYIYIYTHIPVCVCVCVYIYICMYVYVYIYIYTYKHTYIYIYIHVGALRPGPWSLNPQTLKLARNDPGSLENDPFGSGSLEYAPAFDTV